MRKFSTHAVLLAIFALLFSTACTKKVKQKTKVLGDLGPTSTLTCRFTPGFTTFDGHSFIEGFPNNAPYQVGYECEKDGTVVSEAECRQVATTNTAASQAFNACPGVGFIEIPAGTASGLYNVAVRGKDPDTGAMSSANVYKFAIDRDAPFVPNSVVMLSKTTSSFSLDFSWVEPSSPAAPASGIKTVQCLVHTAATLPSSPTWSNCDTTQFSATGLTADTQYWVHFRLEDKAGNVNQDSDAGIKSYSVRTEATGGTTTSGDPGLPGLCSISSSFPGGYTSSATATINYFCENPNLTNRCILYVPGQTRTVNDGGIESGFQNCDETAVTRSISQEGSYQFCVADAEAAPVRCQTFTRDTIVPTVAINSHSITATAATISFSGTDSGSGISRFTCAMLKRGSNGEETVYNALGQVVSSIGAALDNSAIPCGAIGVPNTSVSFDSSVIAPGTEYLFYARSFDNAGLKSVPANQTLINTSNQLACVISPKLNGAWKNSTAQTINYECSQWNPKNVTLSCQVENTAGGSTLNQTCNNQLPECLTTTGPGAATMCIYRGAFQTSVPNSFLSSGDTLRVRIRAEDRTDSGAIISSASDQDTFRVDTRAPAITTINVHASSSEVQLNFAAQDPGAPLRGSGLKSNLGIKLYEVSGSTDVELLDYDLELICSGVVVSPANFDVRSNCNDLRFGPRNFNPAKNYRVDLTVEDNVGLTFKGSSLVFPGPNPNAGPTCSLQLISGFSVDPASPTSATQTSSRIVCNNPFVEAPSESDHTTRAMCRVTTPDSGGNPVIGAWSNCTGSTANLVNNAPFTWNVFNNGRNPGQVKLEVHGCDSTYTYRCGPISSTIYYYRQATTVVPAWGTQTIEYFNGDDQTQYAQKLCDNPAPAPGGAVCALDTFNCVTTPCYQWQYGATVNGYASENRKLGTCRTTDYIFDAALGRCKAKPITCPTGHVLEGGTCVAACSGDIVLYNNQVITGVVGGVTTCSVTVPAGVTVKVDGHTVIRAKTVTVNGLIDGQGRGSLGGNGGKGGNAGVKPSAGITGLQGASGEGRGGSGGAPGLGGNTCTTNPCTGGSGENGLDGAAGLHGNAKGVIGGGGGGGGGGGAGGYGRERASCGSSTSYGYHLEPGGAGGGGAGGRGGAAVEIYAKTISGTGTIRTTGVQSSGNGRNGVNATDTTGGAGGAGGLATSAGTSAAGAAGNYTSCRANTGGVSGSGGRGGRGGDGAIYIQYDINSSSLSRQAGSAYNEMVNSSSL